MSATNIVNPMLPHRSSVTAVLPFCLSAIITYTHAVMKGNNNSIDEHWHWHEGSITPLSVACVLLWGEYRLYITGLSMNTILDSSIQPLAKKKSMMSSVIQYQNLGKSGLRVSNVALGTWITFGSQITEEMAEEILTLAYESGINVFDTAEVYAAGKAEIVLGKILKRKAWRRSSYIITTKIYWGGKAETEKGLNRKHIIEGLRSSLDRLQLDYVDIVFANKSDSLTPTEGKIDLLGVATANVGRVFRVEEIVRAFTYVINQGWAMYWGTSRWSGTEIMEAYSVARQFNLIPPIVEQAEYNFFTREKVEVQLPELYHKIGLGTMTWSPLACGILTGKYEDGIPVCSRAALKHCLWLKEKILSEDGKRQQQKLRELAKIAGKLKCSIAQLAIAWCLKNENIHSVILGVSTADQLYQNMQALKVVERISPSVSEHIEKILLNAPLSGTRIER